MTSWSLQMRRDMSTVSSSDLIHDLGRQAKAAVPDLITASDDQINAALKAIAKALRDARELIIDRNRRDIRKAEIKGVGQAQIDRLTLNYDRVEAMAKSLEIIAALDNPTGRVLESTTRPNGLVIEKVSVPLGVLGMIYESRPNVTIDAAALALKSRNAIILRGGSECLGTSLFLHGIVSDILAEHDLPYEAIAMIDVAERTMVAEMLHADQYIDVMIPRGGPGLIERVMKDARMPVFAHLDGICHVYIHDDADPAIAKNVTLNAKMRRTGICGAAETLLIDKNFSKESAHEILDALLGKGCALVGDAAICALDQRVGRARSVDWATEYLAPKLSIRMVDGVDEAIEHINHYGSHHTDSILTRDDHAAQRFFSFVDSGIVMRNASTQFADGGEFGMGAEIGIATGKLHARGPVGLEQLTTYKYLVKGTGQIRF